MESKKYLMSDYSAFFRIMANRSRFRILQLLYGETLPLSVSELARAGNIPMSKISDQLMVLRKHSLVYCNREGTIVYYRIDREKVSSIIRSYYSLLSLSENNYYISHIISDPFSDESYKIYSILANETRCEMMQKIATGEKFVNELCDMFYLEQPTISMHLNSIQKNNLIYCKKVKTKKYYHIAPLIV